MASTTENRNIMDGDPPEATMPADRTTDMGFLDHLEELRWRIIKGLGGLVTGIVVAFFFADFIIDRMLLGPTRADFFVYQMLGIDAIDLVLQSRKLPGQFFTYWGSVIISGGIIGSPVLFYQLWAFIEPAMEVGEKHKSYFTVVAITFFFLLGISFGYFVLTPFAVQFFSKFQIADVIHNDFDINKYFAAVTMWVLSCGLLFQMPVLSYFLSRFGLINPQFLKMYRKHALIAALVLAAFLTPPDPVSQILIAVPLLMLYQFSISVSRYANRKRDREIWGENVPDYRKE